MRLTLSIPSEIAEDKRAEIEAAARVLVEAIHDGLPEGRRDVPGYVNTIGLRYVLASSGVSADEGLAGLSYMLANYCADYGRTTAARKRNRHGPVYAVQFFRDALQTAGNTLSQIYQGEERATAQELLSRGRGN